MGAAELAYDLEAALEDIRRDAFHDALSTLMHHRGVLQSLPLAEARDLLTYTGPNSVGISGQDDDASNES